MTTTIYEATGHLFLSLEKDKPSDGAILKDIAKQLNQKRIRHASLKINNKIARITVSIVADTYPQL